MLNRMVPKASQHRSRQESATEEDIRRKVISRLVLLDVKDCKSGDRWWCHAARPSFGLHSVFLFLCPVLTVVCTETDVEHAGAIIFGIFHSLHALLALSKTLTRFI